ncbi:MAG: glycoside hydrolase family 13 [Limisphaerales bacterium]
MATYKLASGASGKLYSGKAFTKPVNFFCTAPGAKEVFIAGDFNEWNPAAHPMQRSPDGNWVVQLTLTNGHHRYWVLVDGVPTLDPRAQGVSRNEKNERVSLISLS